LDRDFEKIRRKDFTLYIKSQFRDSELGEAFLGGEEGLRQRYELKRVHSSEYARIHRFAAEINGVRREIYLKQYLCRSIHALIKCFFFASRARCDYEHGKMLAGNGFNVPEVIAMGQWRGGFSEKGSFLATFAIEDARPINHFIYEIGQASGQKGLQLRELMREVGRATGRMHAKGIIHGDLRLGNILLGRKDGMHLLFFLDNERTRKFGKLPFSLRIKNLTQVSIAPAGKLSNTNRMRFFKEYFVQTGIGKKEGKAIIEATFKKTSRRFEKRQQRRKELRKSTLTKAGDIYVVGGDYRGVFRKGFCADTESLVFMERIDSLIGRGRIIRDDADCLVSVIKWQNREMVAKRFNPRGFFYSLRNTIFKSPAIISWENGHRLNNAGPRPLAYIERRKAGLVWKSYFVTENIGESI
jgi:serine/threonine protein kinase